ncbi:exportin-T-like [Oscarella lobularis]|uniref:exportin-T-like n=1 Tax=Oscarella lobularis TaxID=121494 RepID=UPI00331365C9
MNESALEGLLPTASAQARHSILTYFEQLKASDDGWLLCAETFLNGVYSNQHIQFFLLQVLEHHVRARHARESEEAQARLRDFFLSWIRRQESSKERLIVRKFSQLCSLVLVCDYPEKWPTFFTDLIECLSLGISSIEIYLRILLAISEEVADKDIPRTREELERNTLIKDTMRLQCIPQLVDSWLQILSTTEQSNHELTCLCLEAIGTYVAWIDINLIVNDTIVGLLLKYMRVETLRESAADCLHEIIRKGMDPIAKTKLIESIMKLLENSGFYPPPEGEGIEFVAKLSKLLNGIGQGLVANWTKVVRSGEEEPAAHAEAADEILSAIESKLPLLYRFLGDEDDDVSQCVLGFAQAYVAILKHSGDLAQRCRSHVSNILSIAIKKLRYDESYDFDSEGEDEAMFMEYRKQLKLLFDSLVLLDPELCLLTIRDYVARVFENIETCPFEDTEVALRLVYMLGDTLPGPHFGMDCKYPLLKSLTRMVISSQVSYHSHYAVVELFFETVVRYEKYFNHDAEHLPLVLSAFLDNRGLRHPHARLRSRCSYLFSRFVKTVRVHLASYAHEILKRMQDLLIVEVAGHSLVSMEDQLFLYEAAGALIISSGSEPKKQLEMMKSLVAPVLAKVESSIRDLCAIEDEAKQNHLAQFINHLILLGLRTSKAFTAHQTVQQCGSTECFTEVLTVCLKVLNVPVHREMLHSAVRQLLHRMVVCLGEDILPYVPLAVSHLLKDCGERDLQEFIPFINQLVARFKAQVQPIVNEIFMPIVRGIFNFLGALEEESDPNIVREKEALQKCYFSFIGCIVVNNQFQVIADQQPEHTQEILLTLVHGALDFPEPSTQKYCFSCLKKLVEVWGGGTSSVPGFDEFIYKNIIPACFVAPLKATFDLKDVQALTVLSESGQVMKTILARRGVELFHYLQSEYLPSLNFSSELIQEYLKHLQHADQKTFKNFLKAMFSQLQGQVRTR